MASSNSGSCLCGAVQYRITGDPGQFFVCHCDNCQKVSGSAFMANCWYIKDQVQITQGQESVKTYHDKATSSGTGLKRSFCETCGSSLFVQSDKPEGLQYISVASGTINNRASLHPTVEVWESCRRPWLSPIEGTKAMDTQGNLIEK
ncbi:Mss4-like protein [Aspergillus alliaceus]|uniref:Mss4-like protein n=1 Tax=Petromyces alliaceus TaxID=209559 RepID=A0A5N6FFK5_PETAA|nr:Mss4-like protein [Aspergillus alliaceus]KAB8227995.1 Mss4-like protein [Aspergillus alliaceus]KAE8385547.1 Mss4-like protein [Aspergillus alliaceus]